MNNPRVRARLWIFLLLPLGAGLGFLSLETIGIPLVVLALALIVWGGGRSGNRAWGLTSFGVGFVACVSFFASLSLLLTQDRNPAQTGWFAIQFAFGLAIIVAGLALGLLAHVRERA